MRDIELVIHPRMRPVGNFEVRRLLPTIERRLVGPFIFFDHLGPMQIPPGLGMDVRPHPHIGLATVTYLFEGELFHRDSLGSAQAIVPGDCNWMSAGRGIVHSERARDEVRGAGQAYHGTQAWVALPLTHEAGEPTFQHHAANTLPRVQRDGATLRVIAGEAFGAKSPVEVSWPTLYVDIELGRGARLTLPAEHEERAIHVASGELRIADAAFGAGQMIVLKPGAQPVLEAGESARVLLLGGAKFEGPRHIEWNFVASSQARIDAAKRDWKERKFPSIPGDDVEFVPLPEG